MGPELAGSLAPNGRDGAMTLNATSPRTASRSAGPALVTARSRRCWRSWARTAWMCVCWTTANMRFRGWQRRAAAYVECAVGERVLWGVGIDPSTTTSSLKAVISAVNRAVRDAQA